LNTALPNTGLRQEEVLKSVDQPEGMNSYICNASEGAEHCNVSPAGQAATTADCFALTDSSQRMRGEKGGV